MTEKITGEDYEYKLSLPDSVEPWVLAKEVNTFIDNPHRELLYHYVASDSNPLK